MLNDELKIELEKIFNKLFNEIKSNLYPDKTVIVIAPININENKIYEKLHSKASWILK